MMFVEKVEDEIRAAFQVRGAGACLLGAQGGDGAEDAEKEDKAAEGEKEKRHQRTQQRSEKILHEVPSLWQSAVSSQLER